MKENDKNIDQYPDNPGFPEGENDTFSTDKPQSNLELFQSIMTEEMIKEAEELFNEWFSPEDFEFDDDEDQNITPFDEKISIDDIDDDDQISAEFMNKFENWCALSWNFAYIVL